MLATNLATKPAGHMMMAASHMVLQLGKPLLSARPRVAWAMRPRLAAALSHPSSRSHSTQQDSKQVNMRPADRDKQVVKREGLMLMEVLRIAPFLGRLRLPVLRVGRDGQAVKQQEDRPMEVRLRVPMRRVGREQQAAKQREYRLWAVLMIAPFWGRLRLPMRRARRFRQPVQRQLVLQVDAAAAVWLHLVADMLLWIVLPLLGWRVQRATRLHPLASGTLTVLPVSQVIFDACSQLLPASGRHTTRMLRLFALLSLWTPL